MTEQPKDLLALDLQSVAICAKVTAPPVAILNQASSLHSRLIYCVTAVDHLSMIAEVCGNHENHEVSSFATVFANQLEPLSQLLKHLAVEAETTERVAV